jgi:hypothetical protein
MASPRRSGGPLVGRAATAGHADGDWIYKLGHARRRPRTDDLRFRLNVLSPTVTDVVYCIGGWLFDRSMLGWEVTVLTTDQHDARALRILGASAVDLECVLSGRANMPPCDAISVSAGLYRTDNRVRRHLKRLDRRKSEFTLWDRDWPGTPAAAPPSSQPSTAYAGRSLIVEHRLSLAAQRFKSHALAAVDQPVGDEFIAPTETFCDGRVRNGFRKDPLTILGTG